MERNAPKAVQSTAEFGLPEAIGWYVTATLFAFGGTLVLALSMTGLAPEMTQTPARVASLGALALAPLWVVAGRRRISEHWQHVPRVIGTGLIAGGALYVEDMRSPLLLIFALPMLPAAFMLPVRHALPHVALGAIMIVGFAGTIDEPYSDLRQMILPVVTIGTAVMLMAAQQHLRRVAAIHRELSEIDPLTGVANLRRLRIKLDEELARSQRTGTVFALFAIDLDNFKEVNDKHSHSVGDQVLVASARAIQQELRPIDLLVRRGGDEFIALVPLIGGRDFEDLANRLRQNVEAARLQICTDIRATASVCWVVSQPQDSPEAVIGRADDALHAEKLRAHPERTAADLVRNTARPGRNQLSRTGRDVAPIRNLQNAITQPLGTDLEAAPRLDSKANGQPVAWGVATMLTITGALAVLAAGVTGVEPAMTRPAVVASAIAIILLAPLHMWTASRGVSGRKAASLVTLLIVTLIATGLVAAGEARVGALELLLPTIFFMFYFTKASRAVPYVAVNLGLFGYFLLSSDYKGANVRFMVTTAVVSLLAGMFALARHRTRQFAYKNALLSQTDPLTGLANVRRLRNRLTDEIERCQIFGGTFTLVMLDLDDFKSVNDVYTHTVGDAMLREVSNTIRSRVRADELAARRGGDEFAIVLTGIDDTGADVFAERIGEAIAELRLGICPGLIPTTSVGWISWQPDEPADVLLQRADLALHRAKQSSHRGRRRELSIAPDPRTN